MGYDTTFDGSFTITPTLSEEHKAAPEDLADEEHDLNAEGGMPTHERSSGRACAYCQWRPTSDGRAIVWDGGEKFYGWLEWLECLVEERLKPWGYILNGEVRWRGEDLKDAGVIYVKNNEIEPLSDINRGPSWARKSE